MDRSSFRTWLEQRGGLGKATIDTYMADAGRVERHYGDLDKLYEEDRLAEALKAEIPGVADKSRASYRTAVRRYREYRETVDPADGNDDGARERIFGLLTFQPEYLIRLMELGETDAAAHASRIRALLRSKPRPGATV